MAFKIKVLNLKQLEQKFVKLGHMIPGDALADALEDGAWVIALEARDNAVAQGLIDSGDLIDSILPVKINQFRVDVRVNVVYGAAHEFGTTVEITERQRRFFWAKFSETGDDMWKALALSETYTIPARPYLRPAIDNAKVLAMHVTARSLAKKIRRALQ